MSEPPVGVCFDMDGVLVQSEDYWVRAQRDDILPTAAPNDDIPLSAITGRNYREVYPDLDGEYDLEISREAFEELFEEHGERIYGNEATFLDGAHELLDELREAGVALALTTSAPWAWIDVADERFDLLSKFDVAISANDIDGPGKPEPDIYEQGAAELGVAPGDCWAVEDSTAGARAAVAAGMTTVGFRGDGDETDLSMVHEIADDATTLREVLLGGV
ncbi:haloacid dehalogenase superfamily, subfamily IA, variant 3 with third motif having DD or ED [Haloarcula vallismortis]|uniref:Haloacid dehalogenase superfamily, subfamily IA, variant 3 with third motif having DD or ED n=2 Tax=Haloarcula vallismortis TaxID=28442 RepID=A0A1H2ZN90_HALVA|nr:HAD family phosphatase [Haloarcula vallismortis]SDX18853.1 haloacid dehalogenase superfamily, subfamily IA, variant 3 with third motif having DD or ED [Haloarcula vallismortis]